MSSQARRDFYNRSASQSRAGYSIAPRIFFVAALLFVALLSLLYVRQTSDLASTGYDVASLQTQESDWTMRNEQLHFQRDQLSSLDRVAQVASTRLGIGPPRQVVYVVATPIALPPFAQSTATPTAPPSTNSLGALLQTAARVP